MKKCKWEHIGDEEVGLGIGGDGRTRCVGLVPTKVKQRFGAARLDRQGLLKQLLCGFKFVLRKEAVSLIDQG